MFYANELNQSPADNGSSDIYLNALKATPTLPPSFSHHVATLRDISFFKQANSHDHFDDGERVLALRKRARSSMKEAHIGRSCKKNYRVYRGERDRASDRVKEQMISRENDHGRMENKYTEKMRLTENENIEEKYCV